MAYKFDQENPGPTLFQLFRKYVIDEYVEGGQDAEAYECATKVIPQKIPIVNAAAILATAPVTFSESFLEYREYGVCGNLFIPYRRDSVYRSISAMLECLATQIIEIHEQEV